MKPEDELHLSLAQWSVHRALENGSVKAKDFAALARTYGLQAVEYVNRFYHDHATDEVYWNRMRTLANNSGVTNLLMMVDEEGDLGSVDEAARIKAVENHYKWINAASLLGCHSIRVNAFGEGSKEDVHKAIIDAMNRLTEYAAKVDINILLENHGLYSSDGRWVRDVIRQVNKPNCGTLPDFGNWCLSTKWGSTETDCAERYDRYRGMAELLPYAKGVSAKSYAFNEYGEETRIDYKRMLQLVKLSGYTGYIGIEFEGAAMPEPDGIRATKALLEKHWEALRPYK